MFEREQVGYEATTCRYARMPMSFSVSSGLHHDGT
jgi:hypothetical protein